MPSGRIISAGEAPVITSGEKLGDQLLFNPWRLKAMSIYSCGAKDQTAEHFFICNVNLVQSRKGGRSLMDEFTRRWLYGRLFM